MACYHPLKGYCIGTTKNGKMNLSVKPWDWIPYDYIDKGYIDSVDDFITIPCGQCIGCRLEYSRQWAVRCMLESEYHESNYFITFTYNNNNVPRNRYIDEDGVIRESLTLNKYHMQQFCKTLRNRLHTLGRPSFRFYCCGEYGGETARPHYHMIAFGLVLTDLKKAFDTPFGTLYTSPLIDDVWGKGNVLIGSVTFESCAYVSRYIMKKQTGKNADVYDKSHKQPEFVNMSRRPGIGKAYFDDNFNDIYPRDKLVLDGGKLVRPPRYFDKLMDAIDSDMIYRVKELRQNLAEENLEYRLSKTDVEFEEFLQIQERNKNNSISRLVRPLE